MTNSLSSSLLRASAYIIILFASAFAAKAQDLGKVELGVRYPVTFASEISGYFIAPQSGNLIVNGDVSLYLDKSHTNLIEGRHTDFINGGVYQYDVTEGTTYYLYQGFNMNSDYILLEMNKPLEVAQNYPPTEFALSSAGYDYVDVWFNQSVTIDHVYISTAGTSVEVDPIISNNKIVSIPFKNVFNVWYSEELISGGEIVTFSIKGIRDANGNLYNGTGDYSIDYRAAYPPLHLISKTIPSTFYSYYQSGDSKAIVSLTFDGDLLANQHAQMTITYGDIETDVNDFYQEFLYGEVDGPTVTFDLSGKLRSPKNMVPSGTDYGIIMMQIGPIYSYDGSYVDSGEQGSMGSFSYTAEYVDLKYAEIISDFSPANGSDLYNTEEVEIWVSGIDAITWDGVKFQYDIDETTHNAFIAKSNLSVDTFDNEATILVPVAEEIRSAKNIVLSLNITGSSDGFDHSGDVKAMYNTFAIIYSYPANGAQVATLDEGENIVVRINSQNYYLTYRIDDLNPFVEGEGFVTSGTMALTDTNTYSAEMFQQIKFYTGHTYNLTISAYAKESDTWYGIAPLYERTISWEGTSVPPAISDILFVSVDPADGTTLTSESMNTFTLVYDGLVMIDAENSFIVSSTAALTPFESVVGVESDENEGFANTWVLTVPESYMHSLTSSLDLSIRAYDMQGRIVKGNISTIEDSYLYLSYPTTYNLATVEVNPAPGSIVNEISSFTFYVEGEDIGQSWATFEQPEVRDALGEVVSTLIDSEIVDGDNTMVTLTFEKIVMPGTYTLYVPAQYFIVGSEMSTNLSAPIQATYKLQSSAIEDIATDSHAVIYNLNGIKVLDTDNAADINKLPRGIYIEIRNNTPTKRIVR